MTVPGKGPASDTDPVAEGVAELLDPATGEPFPPDIQREMRRYIKRGAYQDILGAFDDDGFGQLVRYSVAQAIAEDDDLCNLEQHRTLLVAFGRTLMGLKDALKDIPWTRFPRAIGWNGGIERMTGGESRLYLALLTLVDPKTLTTTAMLETMADMIERS
jgi:hypothetical protein